MHVAMKIKYCLNIEAMFEIPRGFTLLDDDTLSLALRLCATLKKSNLLT